MRLFIDQYGNRFWVRTVKELAGRLGYKRGSARRIFRDDKAGPTLHVGYLIGQHRLTEYVHDCVWINNATGAYSLTDPTARTFGPDGNYND